MDAFSEQALSAIRRLHAERGLLEILERDSYAGAALARAYLLADRGDFDQALTIAAQVDEVLPELGIAERLSDWFDRKPITQDTRGWVVRRLAGASQVGVG